MNPLDAAIALSAVSAVLGGIRIGFVARALSWVGLAAGLVLASRVVSDIVERFASGDGAGQRLLVTAGVFLGGAFLGQATGAMLGSQFRRVLPPIGGFRSVDRLFGGLLGLGGTLVSVWAFLPVMADVPGWPAQQARNSVVARTIVDLAPPPPDYLRALRSVVGEASFPEVFEKLRPSPDLGPPPPESGLSPATADAVRAATVRIEGGACDRIQNGSGFVVRDRETVVTNAHVVAGERTTEVITDDGRRLPATVTVFDAKRDLAVLRVRGLGLTPLRVGAGDVGARGAVFGHPGGGPLELSPAEVREEIRAVGRDLYGTSRTSREVFVLAAGLAPGDSGGALVDGTGTVIGVAFAIAPDRRDTAYALTDAELRPVLADLRRAEASTGRCI